MLDVRLRFRGRRHGREPELPQRAVGRGRGEILLVAQLERLEPHAVALELDGTNRDHERVTELTARANRTRRPSNSA